MKSKKQGWFLSGFPVWGQSLLLGLITLLLLFGLAAVLGSVTLFNENIGEPGAYAAHALVLAGGCYLICRNTPQALWYAPFLANIFVVISAAVEPTFWETSLWIWLGSALPLSYFTGFLGAKMGRKVPKRKHRKVAT